MNKRMVNSVKAAEIASNPKIGHQLELERLFNKNQLIPRLRQEFREAGSQPNGFDLVGYMKEHRIDPDFGIDLLVQLVLHKRTTMPTMVGILRHHFDGLVAASQMTVNEIEKCCNADLADWSSASQQLIVKLDITEDVQRELDMYQFPLPMIVEPRELKENTDSAYIGCNDGSVILRKNHHEDDVCLDHINKVNKVRFSLDNDVASMIRNQWRNLDKPKPGESKQDFERRKRAFDKYDRTARQVMGQVTLMGNEFYLTHKYDKRGRTYCQGYHVNYQGAPWNKAVIQLADKEIIDA